MFVKRKVLHHDGKTIVIARGLIGQDNVFNGEYRFEGFTWGVEIQLHHTHNEHINNFLNRRKKPLINKRKIIDGK